MAAILWDPFPVSEALIEFRHCWLIRLLEDLGKRAYLPLALFLPPSQIPKGNKTLQNNLQLRAALHILYHSAMVSPASSPSLASLLPRPKSLRVEFALSPESRAWHFWERFWKC